MREDRREKGRQGGREEGDLEGGIGSVIPQRAASWVGSSLSFLDEAFVWGGRG